MLNFVTKCIIKFLRNVNFNVFIFVKKISYNAFFHLLMIWTLKNRIF